jgi:DNA-binding transcriptional LysR family regulator
VRLSTPHFMVIPAIVSETDLAVLLPLRIAKKFAKAGRFQVAQPRWGFADFVVGLHWSQRAESDPANRWLRQLAITLFREPGPGAAAAPQGSR